ncbi:glucose-6-phosphate exchanger SLC37A4-like [Branchiostoma floridae x Branchiostoma belcheri]
MAGDTEYNRHRGVIIATMYVGYCFYHLTRKSFGFIMPVVMEEGLDQSDLGLVISSQTMAYAFSKFLSGLASDHLSARSMFAIGLFLCGVCNVVFILFDSVLLYSLLWFINGLVQGFGWPACAKVLRQWFKPSQFGTWWSILATSMNLAGFVGPLVTMEIATRYGWRAGLLIPGVLSLALAVLSYGLVVDEPSHVGLENIVATTQKKTTESKGEAPSMLSLLDSAYLWLISVTYFVVFAVKTSCLNWGQLFLIQDKGHEPYVGSLFTSSLELGGIFGSVIAGMVTDRMVKATPLTGYGSPRHPYVISMLATMGLALYGFSDRVEADTLETTIMTIAFLIGFTSYGAINLFGVLAIENSPSSLSGTSSAIVALAANFGGLIAGYPFGLIAENYNWETVFIILEISVAVSLVLFIIARNINTRIGPTSAQKSV